jgi:hypothetical protein
MPVNRIWNYGKLAYLKTLAKDESSARKAEELSAKETEGWDKREAPQHNIAQAFVELGKLDKALDEAKKLNTKEGNWRRVDIINRVALAQAKANNFSGAEANLKSAGYDNTADFDVQLEVRTLISQKYRLDKDIFKAAGVYDDAIEALEKDIQKYYNSIYTIRHLEKALHEQAKVFVLDAGVNKTLAEWVVAARLIAATSNLEEALQRAKNPYKDATADYIIKCTADVAKRLRIIILKLEQMEKGDFNGPLADFFADL